MLPTCSVLNPVLLAASHLLGTTLTCNLLCCGSDPAHLSDLFAPRGPCKSNSPAEYLARCPVRAARACTRGTPATLGGDFLFLLFLLFLLLLLFFLCLSSSLSPLHRHLPQPISFFHPGRLRLVVLSIRCHAFLLLTCLLPTLVLGSLLLVPTQSSLQTETLQLHVVAS